MNKLLNVYALVCACDNFKCFLLCLVLLSSERFWISAKFCRASLCIYTCKHFVNIAIGNVTSVLCALFLKWWMLVRANLVGTVWLDIAVPYGRSVLTSSSCSQSTQSFLAWGELPRAWYFGKNKYCGGIQVYHQRVRAVQAEVVRKG